MEDCDLESLKISFAGNEWCEFNSLVISDESISVGMFIQPGLSWFTGHFPDQPVLPGVVQTHWVCELAQQLFTVKGLKKVNNLKFKTMVLPGTQLTLKLSFNALKNSVVFSYQNDNDTFSTGSLLFSD